MPGLPRRIGFEGRGRAPGADAELSKTPGATVSLREGIAKTTTMRLAVPPTRTRTLRSANPFEPMFENCRRHSKTVKGSRNNAMALHGRAAGMLEATSPAASTATGPPAIALANIGSLTVPRSIYGKWYCCTTAH